MRRWKLAAAGGAVLLAAANGALAVVLTSGSDPHRPVQVIASSGATDPTTSTTVAPTTTTAPSTTTTPEASVTTTTATTTTTVAPSQPTVQPQMRVTAVTYTVGGSCARSASPDGSGNYTVNCNVTVKASDGSVPTGDAILIISGAGADQQPLSNGATTLNGSYPSSYNITSVDVGYRGGPNKGADTVFPIS